MVNLGKDEMRGLDQKLPPGHRPAGNVETGEWFPRRTPDVIHAATLCTENKVHVAITEYCVGGRNQQISAQTCGGGACWRPVTSADLHDDWDLKGQAGRAEDTAKEML